MKGKIIISEGENMVEYRNAYEKIRTIPVFSSEFELNEGADVEFTIVDEFTHPHLFRNVPIYEGMPSAVIQRLLEND
jgi:hypothetical protein